MGATNRTARWWRWSCSAVLMCLVMPATVGPSDLPVAVTAVREATATPVNTLYAAVSRCRATLPERDRWRIAGVIHRESQRFGYDPLFVLAMVTVESRCHPHARGRRGGIGLLQIRLSTARTVALDMAVQRPGIRTLTQPSVNLQLGLRYLAQLEERFGDPYVAMAAYNMGPTRAARLPRHRLRHARYVRKILAEYEDLLSAHRRQTL